MTPAGAVLLPLRRPGQPLACVLSPHRVAGWGLAERSLRIGRELAPRRRGGYHYFR